MLHAFRMLSGLKTEKMDFKKSKSMPAYVETMLTLRHLGTVKVHKKQELL